MTQITVKLTGADNVQVGLSTLGAALPNLVNDNVAEIMESARYEASGGWSGGNSYTVPEVYGQTYIRTGVYGRSTYVVQDGRSYRLLSEAPYAVQVGGDSTGAGQGRDFIGRWPNIAQVVTKWADTLTKKLDDVITASAEAMLK